jgi:hypothetical protein
MENMRGIIEDFLWDIEQLQKENLSPRIDELCDNIIYNLGILDEILKKQEERDYDL